MRLFSLLLVFLVLLGAAGAASAQADEEAVHLDLAVRIPLLDPDPDAAPDQRRTYRIERSGRVTFMGASFTDEELLAHLATLSPDHEKDLEIAIDPRADSRSVVSRLARFGSVGPFHLLNADLDRTFTDSDTARTAIEEGPLFQGTAGRFEMPVTVGLDADGKSCVARLGSKTYADAEFASQSFRWLDALVMREGGVESLLAKASTGQDIVARIQSSPQTPWRCVAGATRAVQLAGWPAVQLEVVGR
jgi:hypothetical protein